MFTAGFCLLYRNSLIIYGFMERAQHAYIFIKEAYIGSTVFFMFTARSLSVTYVLVYVYSLDLYYQTGTKILD